MSEDVCFLNHDPEAQKSADRFFLDRQKPLNEQSEVERNAWQSWQDCAAVCDADPAGHDLDSHHPHIGAKGDEDEEIRNPRLAMSSWVSAATQARLELRRAKRAVGAKEEQMQASGHRHGHGGHGGHRINKTGKAPHSSGYLDDAAIVERRKSRQCFQWRYHDGVCCVGKSFRQGKPRRPSWEDREKLGEDRARWHSGWHVSGIRDWVDAMGECEAQWVKVR